MKKIKGILGHFISWFCVFITPFRCKGKVLSKSETIEKLRKNNISLIRFGDGEFSIYLNNKDIYYQKFSNDLKLYLKEIERGYSKESNYMLAIPNEMFTESILWFFKHKKIYLSCFAKYRVYFRYFMKKNAIFGDAMCFIKSNYDEYIKLWEDVQDVVFVHNDEKWAKSFEEKFKKKTYFVKTPNSNAFENHEQIINKIIDTINLNKLNNKEYKILISAGPAAKVIVYKLSLMGIVAYDVGHIWDEPLTIEKRGK